MSSVIATIERAQLRRVPDFAPGDRVKVHFQVIEGQRSRVQVFEGVVIKRQGHGARETFTVRKQSFGVGVERMFPLHSPKIERIELAARGDVRRAKLYYLRDRVGKRARVRERRYTGPEVTVEPGLLVEPEAAAEVEASTGVTVPYIVGTMVETPRAALIADQLAGIAQFLSFGTNDLTQLTYGFSRDDVEAQLLTAYVEQKLLPVSPFASLDPDGVGALISTAITRARSVRPTIKLGICGEHGGDPASIAFCQEIGLDYVSCSPYRVPVARLAAAQAAVADLRAAKKKK